jgi:hypothetical protein
MSIADTIKSLLDGIPDKDCVRYDPSTGDVSFLFEVQYRTRGKWRTLQLWAESAEHAARDVDDMTATMALRGQVLVGKRSA